MQVNTYLTFDGRCEEAFRYYRDLLGGRIEAMITHGESPACSDVPFEWYESIAHACLVVGDTVLMGSDAPPGHFEWPAGMSVALAIEDPTEAERVFQGLSEAGLVRMPMQETFWARRFGMVTDRFGIPWMVNGGLVDCQSENVTEEARCAS